MENILSKKTILLTGLILLLFGGLFGTKFLQINKGMSSKKAPPPPTVTTVTVSEKQWATTLSAVGNINPVLGVILSNEVAGTILKLHFESGQTVKQGDLLIELNTATDRAKLDGFIAAQKLAQLKFNRQAKLLKSKTTSRSSHDEARAVLDLAKAAAQAQRSILDKLLIRAPFDGVIGIRQVSLGQYIDKGFQIAPLVSFSSTIADFSFSERHFASLKVDQTVHIKVQAYPGETFEGKIQAINPGLHEETRTIAVRAILNNPEHKLRAGMFADIEVIVSEPTSVLVLPETTITYNTYGENVFVVNTDGGPPVVELRGIKTGMHNAGFVEITHGLSLNDTVINEGHVKLKNGMPVTISPTNQTQTK